MLGHISRCRGLRLMSCWSRPRRRRLTLEPLEPRVVLDGLGMADVATTIRAAAADDQLLVGPVSIPEIKPAAVVDWALASEQTPYALAEFTRFGSPEELRQYLIQDALERYAGLFGKPYWPYVPYDGPIKLTGGDFTTAAEGGHSETNVQVAGVDEGDIVETDGNFLYVLSGDEVVIVDARTPDQLHVDSRVKFEDQPFAQYLSGDRLTVLSRSPQMYLLAISPFPTLRMPEIPTLETDVEAIYPYTPPPPPHVTLTVLDISNRESPTILQQTEMDGWYVDSRAIGNFVYLVLSNGFYLPPPEVLHATAHVEPLTLDEIGTNVVGFYPSHDFPGTYETQEQYLARISGQVLDLALPHFTSKNAAGETLRSGLLSEATEIYRPILSNQQGSLVSVVGFDVLGSEPGLVATTSVPLSGASQVYVSAESLYLLQPNWAYSGGDQTSIVKFDLDPAQGKATLAALGTLPGRVLDRFSVDEYGGYLRVATTQGVLSSWKNNLFVLQQDGELLKIIGSLEGLTPGERIYSARFMGDRAFVVTFRQTDPLLSIDLSNPRQPELEGELVIPGFSNYLQSIAEGYLIGIGRNALDNGLFQDPQISLFNVADFEHPEMAARFTIPVGREGRSEALYDPHAVGYYPEYQVLAVPVTEGWQWRTDEHGRYLPPRTDLWVFRIDVSAGAEGEDPDGEIQLLGRIEQDSTVRRSLRIGSLLYAVSEDTITAHQILDPTARVGKLYFGIKQLQPAEFVELEDLDLSAGDHWYRFKAAYSGPLTLEATGGDARVELYGEQGTLLPSPQSEAGRVDWQVTAGQEYSIRLYGSGTQSGLRLANLVERSGDRLIVHGTGLDDRFRLDMAAALLAINDVEQTFDPAEIATVTFEGGWGNDTAVVLASGGDETAEIWPDHGILRGTLTVHLNSVESIDVQGRGGNDRVTFYDSLGNDTFAAWPGGGSLAMSTGTHKAAGFETVIARSAAGGLDVVKLYDSPGNDTFVAAPGYASLSGAGFELLAWGFDAVHAYATTGLDVAKLFDSPGDDNFYADPTQGALYGPGFYDRAKFFDAVHAYATAGGHDAANLYGSGGDDVFHSEPEHGALYGAGFYNRAKYFEEVYARGAGGNDTARLIDSAGNDRLEAEGSWARLSNAQRKFAYWVGEFQSVKATSRNVGDTSHVAQALDVLLQAEGLWQSE